MFSVNQLNLLAQHHKVACCTAYKGKTTKPVDKNQATIFESRQKIGTTFRSVLKTKYLDKNTLENPSSNNNKMRRIKRELYQDKKERDLRQKTISHQDIEIEYVDDGPVENYNIDECNYNVVIEQEDQSPSKPRNAIQFDVHHINSESQNIELLEQSQLKKIGNSSNDVLVNINENSSLQFKQEQENIKVSLPFIKNDVSCEMELESTNKLNSEDQIQSNSTLSKMNYNKKTKEALNKSDDIINQTKRDLNTPFKILRHGQYRVHRNSSTDTKGNTFLLVKTKSKPNDCKLTCVNNLLSHERFCCNSNTVQNTASPTDDIVPKRNAKYVNSDLGPETIQVNRSIDDYRTVIFDPTVSQTSEEENISFEEKAININTFPINKNEMVEYLESYKFKIEENATISDYKIFEYFWKLHPFMNHLNSDDLAEYKLHILKKIYEITS